MTETIAFIGLGDMGGPMSANLARKGYTVAGYDADRKRLAVDWVRPAASVEDAVRASDGIVISLVRTLQQTEQVSAQIDRAGATVLLMSTIDPVSMERVAADLAERGVAAVDAPVSGGVIGAEKGTLTIMFSGPPAAKARVRPVLEAMGRNLFDMGDKPGLGQAVKLANQLMLVANMMGVHEGMRLAARYGLTEEQVREVVSTGVGGSFMLENWERQKWEYTEGNAFEIVYKDLRSILNAAAEDRIPLPITALGFNRMKDVWGK